jgi:hypothetical protein
MKTKFKSTGMKDLEKMVELFRKSKDTESEKIELDNLDEAWLTYSENNKNEVVVENEHGTQFSVSDLSSTEIFVFIYVLLKS